MTPRTTQKIVLTALGGSVATPKDGVNAQVLVVDTIRPSYKALSRDAVKGKILLFNEHFDKGLAARARASGVWRGRDVSWQLRRCVAACHGRNCGAGALGRRRGLQVASHRGDVLLRPGLRKSRRRR